MTTQFEDRLLTALLDEYETLTAPDARRDIGRRPRRKSLLTVGSIGFATAAAAAAAVVVVVSSGTPGEGAHAHARRAVIATAPTVAAPRSGHRIDVRYVVHGIDTALGANTDVLHELINAPDSQTGAPTTEETWSRGGTDTSHSITLNAQGQPQSGVLMTITPHQTITTTIDYAAHTYTQHTYPFGSDTTGPAPAPATPVGQAAALRQAVNAGQVTLVGPATIDGQQTIVLRDTRQSGGTIELWVDPSSYLPVQEIDISTGQTADSPQSIRTRFQWLPATAVNLGELTPAGAIPAGFQPATGA